ncbi:hypothetical protein scyTo_0022591 [Scyliorhinus torazame]|uniref:Uncharacterized protein n=1 Tax=Scyliorhinus torazame TaxID=75743 RepID=A0A401Q961_SCYTO|nr:hypothetical protein [Scyliorhinus torazame]
MTRKVVFFMVDHTKEKIIVNPELIILVGDVLDRTVADPLRNFIDPLPKGDHSFALSDSSFETKKEELEL